MQITRDALYKVVCMILTPSTGKVGTGCFIQKDGVPYLVTAEHVNKLILPDSVIVFGESNSTNHIVLLSGIAKGNWQTHPIADLSLTQLDGLDSRFNDRFFPYNQVSLVASPISRERELTTVGFPQGLGTTLTGSSKFSPLTFRSYASSSLMSMKRADNSVLSDFFCLENPAMGGYSGGPVFDLGYIKTPVMTQSYGDTTLLGFIHGTQYDETGGKLALVTPSYYLKDLLH